MFIGLSPPSALPTRQRADPMLPSAKRSAPAPSAAKNRVEWLLNPSPEPEVAQQQQVETARPAASKKRVRDSVRRREQCRTNQQRYRDKQKFAVLRLEADVMELRQVIKWLEESRSALAAGRNDLAVAGAARMVQDFCAMFRCGLSGASLAFPFQAHRMNVTQASRSGHRDDGSAALSLLIPVNADDQIVRSVLPQLAFMRTMFAPDIDLGVVHGFDALVEQWWRYSCYFSNLRLALDAVEVSPTGDDGSSTTLRALARVQLTVVVTATTISKLFPHLEHHDRLKRRLVGQKVVWSAQAALDFADRGGRLQVYRVSFQVDFVAALALALGNLVDTAVALDGALISPSGLLGDLADHPCGNSWDDM